MNRYDWIEVLLRALGGWTAFQSFVGLINLIFAAMGAAAMPADVAGSFASNLGGPAVATALGALVLGFVGSALFLRAHDLVEWLRGYDERPREEEAAGATSRRVRLSQGRRERRQATGEEPTA